MEPTIKYSAKVVLRPKNDTALNLMIPFEVKQKLNKIAKLHGLTMTQTVEQLINEFYKQFEEQNT